jgi:Domain of unknown function (DUF4184)
MPFTLAHPAAVLPLRRVRLMRTVPLIVGAMAPDVPYFLPWRLAKHIPVTTHTFLGTFTLDLPIGLLLLVLFWSLRAPLAAPLPFSAAAKCFAGLERFGNRASNWVLAPLAILIGSWTHLVWDSFTHETGWMVSRISALSAPVSFFSYTGELCHVLQYASSVFGLAVLAIWFALLPIPEEELRNGERSAGSLLLIIALVAAAAAAGGFETMEHIVHGNPARYHVFYLFLTRSVAWYALLHTAAGIVILLGRRRSAAASVT